MKKLCACLIFAFVILQVFFIPVAASDSTGSQPVVQTLSLAETTIRQDFGLSANQSFESDVIGGSFSTSEPYVWEILTAAVEKTGGSYTFFLYVYNRGTSSIFKSPFSISLSDPSTDEVVQTVNAEVIDFTQHAAKVSFSISASSQAVSFNNGNIEIDVYSISFNGRSSRPFFQNFQSGSSASSLGLIFNNSSGRLLSRALSERLSLKVTLMCDRFSSNDIFAWYQLNTAAFNIPNSYFQSFGSLKAVSFEYDLYEDVPMLVLEQFDGIDSYISDLPDMSFSSFFNPSHFSLSDYSYLDNPFSVYYHLWDQYYPEDVFRDFSRYFVFCVDEINDSQDGSWDFTPSEALHHLDFVKGLRRHNSRFPLVSLREFIKASSSSHISSCLTDQDHWSTSSFSDSLTWLGRLLFSVLLIDVSDDSLDQVPAIQAVSEDLASFSDEDLSNFYKVDRLFCPDLRSLYNSSLESESSLYLLRFCLTDYEALDINGVKKTGEGYGYIDYFPFGYVCKNAIIDEFRIINFDFEKTISPDNGPTVLVTTVFVDMEPISFIGGGQSPSALGDKISDYNYPVFGFFKPFTSFFANVFPWLKRIGLILLGVLAGIVLLRVLSFVLSVFGVLRRTKNSVKSAFGTEDDRKARKEKRRLRKLERKRKREEKRRKKREKR